MQDKINLKKELEIINGLLSNLDDKERIGILNVLNDIITLNLPDHIKSKIIVNIKYLLTLNGKIELESNYNFSNKITLNTDAQQLYLEQQRANSKNQVINFDVYIWDKHIIHDFYTQFNNELTLCEANPSLNTLEHRKYNDEMLFKLVKKINYWNPAFEEYEDAMLYINYNIQRQATIKLKRHLGQKNFYYFADYLPIDKDDLNNPTKEHKNYYIEEISESKYQDLNNINNPKVKKLIY